MDSKGKKQNPARKIKALLQQNMKKDRLMILMLAGILLIVIAVPVSDRNGEYEDGEISKESDMVFSLEQYSYYLEQKLEDSLSKIEGAGEVSVMITWKSSSEKIVEKDKESTSESLEETDSQGGSRTTKNITSSDRSIYRNSGEGSEEGEPYVTKEISPVVEGVIIIAQGGDHPVVVQNITEAVQALFDIDTHKIKVMKGN
ncbi:MAG: stage III sporulation protein AG [Eubacteriales bacterium]|nr:stage III sporulation protein AG [Eubacteriales bacterium]